MTPNKNNLAVVKSNVLNQASYRLTLVEMQIILMAIANINNSNNFSFGDTITIKAKDFAVMFNSDLKSTYAQLKEAVDKLFIRFVQYTDIDEETGFKRVNKVRWISKASYIDDAGNVQFVFSSELKNHLTFLKQEFTAYRIQQIGHLSSIYAVRIYELLIQFKGSYIKFITVDELRNILGLTTEHKLFADFKIKVLDIAMEQINKHTDMCVKYELAKTGRKYTDITFKFVLEKENTTQIQLTDKQRLMYAAKLSKYQPYIREFALAGEFEKNFFKRILKLLEDLELNNYLIVWLYEVGFKPARN